MGFYVAKGLQLAGLCGIGLALYVGINQEALSREIFLAALSAALFYTGRRIES